MSTVMEYFQAGRLNDAVAAAIEQVRSKPGDINTRWHLCSLLCFTGDFERVDKHLDLIAAQDAINVPGVALFRQLVRAEVARRQFFAEGRLPEFLSKPTEDLQQCLTASIYLREGKQAEAAALLRQADEKRRVVSGTYDGKPFSELRDLDDLTATVFEVLTSTGKYYWVPMDTVRVLEPRPLEGPRDLFWRRARMAVVGGPDGEVYLPTLYPNSSAATDDRLRLGRATEWIGGDSSVLRGVGQRMFLVGEDAVGIGDLKSLEFEIPADGQAADPASP